MNKDFGNKADGLIAIQQICFAIQDTAAEPLQLGVDISLVREVLPFRRITPVPLSPAGVVGIFDWRGRIIPVMDLSRILGYGKASSSPRNRLLVLQRQDGYVAFLVSQVIGIVRTVGSLEPVPPEVNLDLSLVRGSIRSPQGRVILLDPEAIQPGIDI